MNGHFVITLDFEKHWGVFDKRSAESYKRNLENVDTVIAKLLKLADEYNVKLTFATVGFLFAENKGELIKFSPQNKPSYTNTIRSPYQLINTIGNSEEEDPFHYALSSIKKIKDNGNHEIGTHTYSHYYCHEKGQTVKQFEDDLIASIEIAKSNGIKIESIIFPRNMILANKVMDKPYLDVCQKLNIKSFRGKEKSLIYTTKYYKNWYIFRILRLLDTYFNITGYNTYKVESLYKENSPLNLPSSRILRAYSKTLKNIEFLKIKKNKKCDEACCKT